MQTQHQQRHHAVPSLPLHRIPVRASAGAALWQGSISMRNAAGAAAPGADTVGLSPVGLVFKGLDNTGGPDGVWGSALNNTGVIEVDTCGVVGLPVTGTAPVEGQPAFIVDNETVTAAATTQNHQFGVFVRPSEFRSGEWMVRYDLNG